MATSLGGKALSLGQIQQLQWVLPARFGAELLDTLQHHAVADAKLRFGHAGVEHWWGTFDAERMLDELLNHATHSALTRDALLPFAGCGRQRMTLYWIQVQDLSVWCSDLGCEAQPLGLSLRDVLANAVPEPRARVRRRLPTQARRPRLATATAPRSRSRKPAACERTLMLF